MHKVEKLAKVIGEQILDTIPPSENPSEEWEKGFVLALLRLAGATVAALDMPPELALTILISAHAEMRIRMTEKPHAKA
jgi:hypothetical protein